MRENHLRVASGPRFDCSHIARLEQMLDEEILPRLERPGRYVGPFEVRGVEPKSADPVPFVLLWPSLPDSVVLPAPLRPTYEAVRQRWGVPPEIACAPAPDLERELIRYELPLFSRPGWQRLGAYELWLVWLREPSQLLGLLTMLDRCGLPLRAERREADAPVVIAAGPGARRAPEILRPFCEAVVLSGELEGALHVIDEIRGQPRSQLLQRLAGLDTGEVVASLSAPESESASAGRMSEDESSGPQASSSRGGADSSRPAEEPPGIVASDLHLPPRETSTNALGTPVTLLRPWAASERLRSSLGLVDGNWLTHHVQGVFEAPVSELVVQFGVGLPGETPEDREAIVGFVREIVKQANHGPKQVLALVSPYVPAPHEVGAGTLPARPGEARAWLERLTVTLRQAKVRCAIGDLASAWINSLLAAAPAHMAPVVERVHRGGARLAESGLARRTDLWHKALQAEGFGSTSEPGTGAAALTPLAALLNHGGPSQVWDGPRVEAAATGLRWRGLEDPRRDGRVEETRSRRASGSGAEHRVPESPPDRWKRWQSLAPRQFDYRVEFAKRGRLRHLGHRELAAVVLRACREAGLPLATAGLVQPRPKIVFGPPLPVGVEGLREYVDVSLTRKVPDVAASLNARLPDGLTITQACFVPAANNRTSLGLMVRVIYESTVASRHWIDFPTGPTSLKARVASLRQHAEARSVFVAGEASDTDLVDQVAETRIQDQEDAGIRIGFVLDLTGAGVKCKPRDVLAHLVGDLVHDLRLLPLVRTGQLARLDPGSDRLVTPLEQVRTIHRELRAREKQCA